MKNRFAACVFIALSFLLFACKDSGNFTISGTIKNPAAIKNIYLLAADSASINVVDSATLNNGKFEFKHKAPYANLYKLRIGGTIFDFIAKNGENIDFTTDLSDNKHVYTISGSEESEKIQEFNKISNVFSEQYTQVSNEYMARAEAIGQESDSLMNTFQPRVHKIAEDNNRAILKFANENKNSLAAFYAMASIDPPQDYELELIKYAEDIKDKFTDNPGVTRFKNQMAYMKPVTVGQKAPDFIIAGIDGKPVKLADYKGKYVMLDFWASWCAPCRAENPNIVRLYSTYHPKGLNIIGVSLDTDKPSWQKAVNDDKLTWTHGSNLMRFEGPTELDYRIEAIPSNFILDPEGVIIAKNITGTKLEDFLKKTFSNPQ
ncbi:TlpA disulfide reductase family protein [Mucilaginibacter puniceus]